jgi:carbonic anhydrase
VAAPTPTLRGEAVIDRADALQRLLQGNGRYALNYRQAPGRTPERRVQVAEGQHPFAAIVCDADSRVLPEVIFDQGLGDLFVVRTVGLALDDEIIGSLEYAVEHLGVKHIMVLGQERSGAIRFGLEVLSAQRSVGAELEPMLTGLDAAVEAVHGRAGDQWLNVINEHALRVSERLAAAEPVLADYLAIRELSISAARYDLDTGLVTILQRPPGYDPQAHDEAAQAGDETEAHSDPVLEPGQAGTPHEDAGHGEATPQPAEPAPQTTPKPDDHGGGP